MKVTFDPDKNRWNIRKRSLSFERAVDFDFETAVYFLDRRHEYVEDRIVTLGYRTVGFTSCALLRLKPAFG
jgi:uncharacterized protein